MNSIFNTFIQKSILYIFVILFAYIISTFIFLFLPKKGIEYQDSSRISFPHKNYDGFYSKIKVKTIPKIDKKIENKNLVSLVKYKLKAVYSTTSNSGWAVIQDGSRSIIIEQYQKLDGYTLSKLFKNYIVFEKNLKEYKLELPKEKEISYEIKQKTSNGIENILVKDDNIQIKRNYLNTYVNNIDKVWQDINIKDIRKNGRIEGFKIYSVNKNSIFGKLGLKKNDVIKSVNDTEIKSYADAFKIYNEINKLEYLSLEILRNNEIVEIDYEID